MVDLVNNDQPIHVPFLGYLHHLVRSHLYPALGIDHNSTGLHRRQNRHGPADKIRIPRSINQVDMTTMIIHADDGSIQ